MRQKSDSVGENRPQMPCDESTIRRRLKARPIKESRDKFVIEERGEMAESKSVAQSRLASVSFRNPDDRSLPRKVDRTKNGSAIDALRSTQIPGPRRQTRLTRDSAAKLEPAGRDQTKANPSTALRNKGAKSVKAKSMSLIADVVAGCRIPQPIRNRSSFDWRQIGEVSASQPQNRPASKSGLVLKADPTASQVSQVNLPSSGSSVGPINNPNRSLAVHKSPSFPKGNLERVRQTLVNTSSSDMCYVHARDKNSHQTLSSGKDASNSSSYSSVRSLQQRQSSHHRTLENSNGRPGVDFLLPDGATGIPSIGSQRGETVVLEVGLLNGSIIFPAKRFTSQNSATNIPSLTKCPSASDQVEPSSIEMKYRTSVKQTEPSHELTEWSEAPTQNTPAPAGRALREVNSPNHGDWQTGESHNERLSGVICRPTPDNYLLSDDEAHKLSTFSATPNWNVLELNLENDSFSETQDESSRSYVIHKTSDDGRKDRIGNERYTKLNDVSDVRKRNIILAASSNKNSERHCTNATKLELAMEANAIQSSQTESVLSAFSDFINKRLTTNSRRSESVGTKNTNEAASHSKTQEKGAAKKCSRKNTKELSMEGSSSAMRSCPVSYSFQSSKTHSSIPHFVMKQDLIQKTPSSKIKPCQGTEKNLNELSHQVMPDQIISPRGSRTTTSQKHLQKCLQPKAINISIPQRHRRGQETETMENETNKNETRENKTRENETKILTPEIQTREKKIHRKTTVVNRSKKEAEAKISKPIASYKETIAKTSMAKKEDHKCADFTELWSKNRESTKSPSPTRCHKESDAKNTAPENLFLKETKSKKVTDTNKSPGETELKTVTPENKSHKRLDSRKVTFGRNIYKVTDLSAEETSEDDSPCRRTEAKAETANSEQQRRQRSSGESPKRVTERQKTRGGTTQYEASTSENCVQKDFEIVVLKSQARRKKATLREKPKSRDNKGRSSARCPARRGQTPVGGTSPTRTTNLTNLLTALHADKSGRQVVHTTGPLIVPNQGGCPFKGLSKAADSGAKRPSNRGKNAQGGKAPIQVMDQSIEEREQGLEFRAKLDSFEEELDALFKALNEGEDLLSSSSNYDSDTSVQSSSSPSPPPLFPSSAAAAASSNCVPPGQRGRGVVKDEWNRRGPRCSTARFYKFLPALSPAQNLLSRIPQNKRDPTEWFRAQTALDAHREAVRHQPKRATSETSYFSPPSKTADDPRDPFDAAADAATTTTPIRYPKISDIRFNEGPNLDLCSVNAADSPNFWVTLFVEMPTKTNTSVYNIKIDLACCALRAFFDPCDRIKFAYVRSVREKLMELIQDGLARPKFEEFVCCERYDCVLVVSLDAGTLLRHPKTSFIYSLSAVLEVEPSRVLVLVSTDS